MIRSTRRNGANSSTVATDADMVIAVTMHTPLMSSGSSQREENRGVARGSKGWTPLNPRHSLGGRRGGKGGLITRRSSETTLITW